MWILITSSRLQVSLNSFNVDAARLWNNAPIQISTAPTLSAAKTAMLNNVKQLPVSLQIKYNYEEGTYLVSQPADVGIYQMSQPAEDDTKCPNFIFYLCNFTVC